MIQTILIYAIPILLAITLHEAAHAFAARYFGDTTAYMEGRMTLNPIKHVDPIGTILIPLVLFVLSSPILFGYAKPVPVNYGRLRNPRRHSAFVAFAGPLSNLLMALMWMIIKFVIIKIGIQEAFFLRMTDAGFTFNLMLFAFNLFPLPPMDGGRIVTSILPPKTAYRFAQIEPYGMYIVLALAFLKVLNYWMIPVMEIARTVLLTLLHPLSLLL